MPKSGVWRFTFSGTAFDAGYNPPNPDGTLRGNKGYVHIKVDGNTVARTYVHKTINKKHGDEGAGFYAASLNTLQRLEEGQNVSIEWDTIGINFIGNGFGIFAQWTGMYLGSGDPLPPKCENNGQTFEYPGSCRKYYQCKSDSTADVVDCCPDIYVHKAKVCLPENLVKKDSVCHYKDKCL